jgi:hypothetical protein
MVTQLQEKKALAPVKDRTSPRRAQQGSVSWVDATGPTGDWVGGVALGSHRAFLLTVAERPEAAGRGDD